MAAHEKCACKCSCGNILMVILLILNIVASSFAWYYGYQSYNIGSQNYNLEVIRGGGSENFETMNAFYQSSGFVDYVTTMQAEQIAAFEGVQPSNTDVAPEVVPQPKVLEQAAIEALKASGKVLGDENADITILEFADANCYYCKLQVAENKTVQTIMDAYPNVNMVYKNMPVLGSIQEAQAMECFGANSSVEDYYTFVEAVYANNAGFDNIFTIAEELGADVEALKACVEEGTFAALVDAQMAEGQSFGINGTPASIIIDNVDGEYKLISGAQPASSFEAAINELLSNN